MQQETSQPQTVDTQALVDRLSRAIVHAPDSPMAPIIASLERMAQSRANVLVVGESGVGKEAIVRGLHDLAPWCKGPFVPLNCGAIPETLLESELFGHVRGAFTGADRPRMGRLEAAAGGTCFMDEIGEMPLQLQVKLLRVLQEMEFTPVGSTQSKKADFRLVAATNRKLEDGISDGTFREDLYFRLDVVRLIVPPLRERKMDIPLLAEYFLALYAPLHNSTVSRLTDGAKMLMQRYDWPGNVRELENLVQGILVLKAEGSIDEEDIQMRLRGRTAEPLEGATGRVTLPEDGLSLKETVEQLERDLIRQALKRSEGNKARAAGLLGMNRTTLVEKLKRQPVTLD
jgi:transcriptional regulator with PAS, ATPase and Fis domain